MTIPSRESLLCRYHYDPLDRLVNSTPFGKMPVQRYYCNARLSTEIQDEMQTSIFQHAEQLLAQQRSKNGQLDTTLLATDLQRSVLSAPDSTEPNALAYSPYGHRSKENGLLSLLGFCGERPDPITGHYHLGNGYRQFNPVLMRFNSPDSFSPFGRGGLNAYAYCAGDPVNRTDRTGRSFEFILQAILKASKSGDFSSSAVSLLSSTNRSLDPSNSGLFNTMARTARRPAEKILIESALEIGQQHIKTTMQSFDKTLNALNSPKEIFAEHARTYTEIKNKIGTLTEFKTKTPYLLSPEAKKQISLSIDNFASFQLSSNNSMARRLSELTDASNASTTASPISVTRPSSPVPSAPPAALAETANDIRSSSSGRRRPN